MKSLRSTLVVSLLCMVAMIATSLPASAHFHENLCIDLGNGCEEILPGGGPVGDPCREIFSDGICSTAEHPWPIVWWVTDPVVEIVTCTISFSCPRSTPRSGF